MATADTARRATAPAADDGDLPGAAAAMRAWLDPALGWSAVQAFGELDSTQTQLRRLWSADAAPAAGGWRLARAERQTAGRGRQGARWLDPPGTALLMTLGGPVPLDAAHWPKLSLIAGLAALQCLGGLADLGADALRLKWPNDLLARTPGGWRKLAGLLTERLELSDGTAVWLCGVGVNLGAAPPALADSATCLADLTPRPLPGIDEIAGRLASALARGALGLAERRGALPLAALEAALAFRGERLRVDDGPQRGERWIALHGLTGAGALWAVEVAADGAALPDASPAAWLPLALLEAQPSGWRAAPRLTDAAEPR